MFKHHLLIDVLVTPRQIYSSQSETSQNSTKDNIQENTTNVLNGKSDHKSDTNATIYAGIVIGIIILIVIALMMYLSRKKVSYRKILSDHLTEFLIKYPKGT